LGVSWCRQDSDLLMSCGKDCKTLIWNPNSGELLGELAQDTNWTFQTEWCPRNPDLLASASFDGKISVYSLQNSESEDTQANPVDTTNDDPFSAAMNASAAPVASSAFVLRHPPKWLRCPVGAAFGFGGKLVTFNNKAGQAAVAAAASLPPGQAPAPQTVPRTVNITNIVTNQETVQRSVELETALESQSIEQLVEDRVQQSKEKNDTDEKESWEVIKTLLAPDAREQLMNYLGFQKSEVIAAVAKATAGKKGLSAAVEETAADKAPVEESATAVAPVEEEATPAAATEGEAEELPALKEEKPDAAAAVAPTESSDSVSGLFQAAGDDFFIQTDNAQVTADDGGISAAATAAIGSTISREPLQLYAEGSSETDRLITRAVVLGDFESAVDLCLSTDRLSDALLFAICGGGDLLLRTQQAYFKRQSKSTSYLRLLESIVGEDLRAVVDSVSLDEWTSVIVVLCTFAKAEDFRPLCEALGARLEEGWSKSESEAAKEFRRHATLCYLAAGNLEKVSRIWITEQEEEVQSSDKEDAYATSLQHLIEKVTIFRKVISYEDAALFETSENKMSYEYALSPLYDKYCEYAELLAAQGKLTTALTYLSLTPVVYRKATFDRLSIIRDRVYRACPASIAGQFAEPAVPFEKKAIVSKAAAYAAETQAAAPAAQSNNTYAAQPQTQQYQSSYQPYQPTAPTTTAQSYAPVRSPLATNSYAPISNAYAPTTANTYAPAATSNYTPTATASVTATGNPTNAYQPQTNAVSSNQTYNNTAATSAYGYNQPTNTYNQPAASGYTSTYGNDQYSNAGYNAGRANIPAPPPVTGIAPSPISQSQDFSAPPKKPERAWNDPPMSVAAAAAKKLKSPRMATAPTKRVTSPFPNQPSAASFVSPPQQQQQQQQQNFPPPPQGAIAPPPMNRAPPQGPPMGGMPPPRANMGPPPMMQQHQQHQQQHQQPPMAGHQHNQHQHQHQQQPPPPIGSPMGPPRNNPLPPPPMNAAPPPPLSKPRGPPPQGGFYQHQRMS
jgi:protein transport protein SEC31